MSNQTVHHELLIASNHIIINQPRDAVWEALTKPNYKYRWIQNSDASEYITSTWQPGDTVAWKYASGKPSLYKDYYRGVITRCIDEHTIEFTMYDAFSADNPEEDTLSESTEETWQFIFETVHNKTKLTINIFDYDRDHDSDDMHDHTEAVAMCNAVSQDTIPSG